jgi:hypothetical protein
MHIFSRGRGKNGTGDKNGGGNGTGTLKPSHLSSIPPLCTDFLEIATTTILLILLGILLNLLIGSVAWGQVNISTQTYGVLPNARVGGPWRAVQAGTLAARPATCSANRDVYICNGAGCTAGQNFHYCTATNTWTVQGQAGGTGITSINGLAGAAQTLTKTDDTNVTVTIVDSGSDHKFNLGWTGLLGLVRGGTGANLSATGGANQFLKQTSAGGAVSVGLITAADLGTTLAVQFGSEIVAAGSDVISARVRRFGAAQTSPIQAWQTEAGVTLSGIDAAGNFTGNAATVTNGVVTTGSYSDPSWITAIGGSKVSGAIPLASVPAHATTHKHGGSDEVATATPGANLIPKSGAGGLLAAGWLGSGTPDNSVFLRGDGVWAAPPGGGGGTWGSITGTLSSQTDLNTALTARPLKFAGSATIDFPSLSAGQCSAYQDVTVTGAAAGDTLALGLPVGVYDNPGMVVVAVARATNIAALSACNTTGGTVNLPSGTYKVMALQ